MEWNLHWAAFIFKLLIKLFITRTLPMSNWRNTIPIRMYRERAQLKGREHLGMLEKKRDYKQRSKDFNQKKATLSKCQHISS
jgi:hypothetical protein